MTTVYGGVAQKGPLVLGSAVTAQELDATLAPTATQHSYQVSSDLGTFSASGSFSSRYLGVSASGSYFDETTNAVSAGPVTLTGISDLSADATVNVNVLSTLASQRIRNLVTGSAMTFTAARAQAEREVLGAFMIPPGTYGTFDSLDISKASSGDKVLAALSALIAFGNSSASVAALMATIGNDIGANGAITNGATKAALAASAGAMNPAAIAANLTQKYASLGVAFAPTDISNWIDQDGDGLVGAVEFQRPNSASTTAFAFPTSATDPYAGTLITVSVGQLFVNAAAAPAGAVTRAGDVVSVYPPPGQFPGGVVTAYLLSAGTRIARIAFLRGLASIALTPSDAHLGVGLTQQMTATGVYTDGSNQDVSASITSWQSSSTGAATVSPTGLVSAVAPGQAQISATLSGVTGTTSVFVP